MVKVEVVFNKMSQGSTSVQSVNRALDILEILKDEPQGVGVTELSNQVGVSKSTIHRLLTSLNQKGFVQQDVMNERYTLGLKLIELGEAVSHSLDVREVARLPLNELVNEVDETAHLAILDHNELVYIDKIENDSTIRMYSRIGKRAPVHCTGVGKAIISQISEEDLEQIINEKDLTKFTDYTLTNSQDLKDNLREIRERGYSIDEQEHELGIRCVACPVFDHRGSVVAGISIAGPIYRLEQENIEWYASKVKEAASKISKKLGY